MAKPFDNLNTAQINKLFDLLEVHKYHYIKGQELIPTIKNDNIYGIILSGSAEIKNIDFNGNETIIEDLEKDSIFGSNITATNNDNYEIIAKEEVDLVVIDYKRIINPKNITHTYYNIFINNIFDIVNKKFQEKNERIRVLEKKQIRERLLEYFDIEYNKSRIKNIYIPHTFKTLADYLAINRSAMFRELKSLKEEKFIEVKGNRNTLLYK